MLDTFMTTALIVLGLFVWIEGGRAHWRLMNQADAVANPAQRANCELQAGLARGCWLAHAFRWAFILFWPLWKAAGCMLAATERARRD